VSAAIEAATAALKRWQDEEAKAFETQDYEFAQQEAEKEANEIPPFAIFQQCLNPE
jgi:hypothetical protein